MENYSGRLATLAVLLLALISSADSYSKFGRSCKDIGCLSQETCVMAHESCSYSQRDGKDCGSYPTCKRNPNGGGSGASLGIGPDNTMLNTPLLPLNPPRSAQDHHNVPNYQNPGPPIDPNNIFGSPMGSIPSSNYNNQPVYPIHGVPSTYPQPYPQIPQHQPMPQYPYAPAPGASHGGYVPQPQQPYAFGNPPPGRSYPTYYVTTTKEPSLWNQFLNNKQTGKKNGSSSNEVTLLLALASSFVLLGRSMCL